MSELSHSSKDGHRNMKHWVALEIAITKTVRFKVDAKSEHEAKQIGRVLIEEKCINLIDAEAITLPGADELGLVCVSSGAYRIHGVDAFPVRRQKAGE